ALPLPYSSPPLWGGRRIRAAHRRGKSADDTLWAFSRRQLEDRARLRAAAFGSPEGCPGSTLLRRDRVSAPALSCTQGSLRPACRANYWTAPDENSRRSRWDRLPLLWRTGRLRPGICALPAPSFL